MSAALRARLVQIESRLAVRAWDYRQRRLAKGAWLRLRRVLADAESAWAISAEDAAALEADGCAPEAVGAELEPARRIYFVARQRLSGLDSRRPLRVGLGADLLSARQIALVRFP